MSNAVKVSGKIIPTVFSDILSRRPISSESLRALDSIAGMGKLRSVVIAVDGSEESMNALTWALENLSGSESNDAQNNPITTFLVLHVQSPPSIVTGLNPGAIPFGGPCHVEVPAFNEAIEAHQRRISEAIISHALKICKEKKVNVKTEVVVGDPKEVICEVVDKLHADLLVMGSHAYGPIKRFFLGSVSNYCINHAQCPVMVVKGPH